MIKKHSINIRHLEAIRLKSLAFKSQLSLIHKITVYRIKRNFRNYRLLQSYYSISIKAFLILRPYVQTIFSLVLSFVLCLSINLLEHHTVFCEWEDQWIQNAPVYKQPDWFQNNQEDPRTLYEQMNGPAWRYIEDHYDLESGDATYRGFKWWERDSNSTSSSESSDTTNSDSNSTSSNESSDSASDTSYNESSDDSNASFNEFYGHNMVYKEAHEIILPQTDEIFAQLGQYILDNTQEGIPTVQIVFQFMEKNIPLSFWSSSELDLHDFNFRANLYVNSLLDQNKNYSTTDIAHVVHYHTALVTYNSAQLIGHIELNMEDHEVAYSNTLYEKTEYYIDSFKA